MKLQLCQTQFCGSMTWAVEAHDDYFDNSSTILNQYSEYVDKNMRNIGIWAVNQFRHNVKHAVLRFQIIFMNEEDALYTFMRWHSE